MDNQRIIGEKIKDARLRSRMTQEQLGEKIGISAMGISHFEQGLRSVKLEYLEKIADALGLSLSYFVGQAPTTSFPNTFYGRINDGISEDSKKEIDMKISEFDRYIEKKFEK